MHILDRLLTLNGRLVSDTLESPSFCGLEPSTGTKLASDPQLSPWAISLIATRYEVHFLSSSDCRQYPRIKHNTFVFL